MLKRAYAVGLMLTLTACGGSNTSTPTTPSSTTPPTTFTLSGQVTDLTTGMGISGATVNIFEANGSNARKSTTTDGSGNYSFTGLQQAGFNVTASATTYVSRSIAVTLTSNRTLSFQLAPVPTMRAFHVTGIATDDDGAPVIGATVAVSPDISGISVPSISSVTDARGAYSIDFDATYTAPNVTFGYVKAQSSGHEPFFNYLFAASDNKNVSMNLHLYRIKRITAGESTVVSIVPGDTNCGEDDELTCRTVRVVVPNDGLLTMSCDPRGDDNGGYGLTIVGYNGRGSSGSEWHVTAGTERAVDIGMWFQSTVSQSCVFKTSLAP